MIASEKKKRSKAMQPQVISEVITMPLHFLNVSPIYWTQRRKRVQHVAALMLEIISRFKYVK